MLRFIQWIGSLSLLLIALALAGCDSVAVVAPPGGNPPPLQMNPVTFTVTLHARAVPSTFRATLDPDPGYPTTGGTDITSSFSPPPSAGGTSTAVVTVNHPCSQYPAGCVGDHRLRVEAEMSPSQAFDSTGQERVFRLQGTPTPPPPPPPPPPPSPDFNIDVTPLTQSIAWGSNATYTVTVRSMNGFNQPVSLSSAHLPAAATASFSPASVTPAANGSVTSMMTISTSVAATELGDTRFQVTGTDSGNQSRRNEADLTIQHSGGPFGSNILPLQSGSSSCGTVTANVIAGPRVQFVGPLGTTNPAPQIGPGYDFSPNCRVGFVIPPPGSGGDWVNLYNLLFESTSGAHGINNPYNFQSTTIEARFSPDDSVVAVIGPAGTGSPRAFSIVLHDLVTRADSQAEFFDGTITSLDLVGDQVTVSGTNITTPFSFTMHLP